MQQRAETSGLLARTTPSHQPLHYPGSRPIAGSDQLSTSCQAAACKDRATTVLVRTTPASALSSLWATGCNSVTSCRAAARGVLADGDYNYLCNLLAAILQLAVTSFGHLSTGSWLVRTYLIFAFCGQPSTCSGCGNLSGGGARGAS
jgi:hypothetical protein